MNLDEIYRRYSRSTNGQESRILHYGDCDIFAYNVCSCGLLHMLRPAENPSEIYPEFWGEYLLQEHIYQYLRHFDYVKILADYFKKLNDDEKINCLVKIGIIKKPKKLSKGSIADIIKLCKNSRKLYALFNAIMDILDQENSETGQVTNMTPKNPFSPRE